MRELRRRLYEITENGAPATHRHLIESLRRELPHSIEVVQTEAPNYRYTCVMHALDVIENIEYIAIANAAPRDVFASPSFVERLIAQDYLHELGTPEKGALVVYCYQGSVKHIGRLLTATRVESKWGLGFLYRHELLEVPENYGSDLRFFSPVDREFTLDRYVEYAREHGVQFEGDA